MKRLIVACVATAMVAGAATATADQLFTSKDIRDKTIQNRDVRDGALTWSKLAPSTQRKIERLAAARNSAASTSPAAVKGDKGDKGDRGAPGPTGATGPQGNPGAPGKDGADSGLPPAFRITNNSVGLTTQGVDFGPYVDGGAAGGSIYFDGLNGRTLNEITALAYTFAYSTSTPGNQPIGAPYLRVFLNNDTADVIYDPSECATADPAEDMDHPVDVMEEEVRYNDDACDGVPPDQQSWDDVVAAHGDDIISGIYVTTGFSGGADLRAFVKQITINGDTFDFTP